MLEKLTAAGFDARLSPTNIGHNQARRTYYAQRCETGDDATLVPR
jgi:hypothetical protein